MTTDQRAEARERLYRRLELDKLTRNHVCADCGAPLVLAMNPPEPEPRLFCGQDRGHQGIRKPRSRRRDATVSLPDGRQIAVTQYERED